MVFHLHGKGPQRCQVMLQIAPVREQSVPSIQTLRRLPPEELSAKIVMVRFDSSILFYQKLDQSISITSNAFFTIKYVFEAGAKIILISSWNVKCNAKILSEEAVAELLSSVLQLKVVPGKCNFAHQQPKVELFEEADVILLENLSKYKQELANDSEFARKLSSGVDIFVNDSFSTAHKILASTVGVTQFCYACVAGFYFEECLIKLKTILECTHSPSVGVVGGGNLRDKAAALRVLASKCDGLVFVGMMALQIMHAMGMPVPLYLVEKEGAKEALEIVKYAESRSIPILLPSDFLCKHKMQVKTFPAQSILDGWKPVDLGPNSFIEIATFLSRYKKIIWIGPVKVGQSDQKRGGESRLVHILDEVSQHGCHITIIGHMACEAVREISRSSPAYCMVEHASVVWEYLKGRSLPGLLALDRAYTFEIEWNMIYPDPTQSLAVDIGSGNGLFLMGMANMRKDLNFLGLEINKKLVTRCLESADQSGLKNLHFIATNATSSFQTIVSSYPGQLVLVSIQCPNPNFNQPEHRWRMVQRSLVQAIISELAPGGKVFLQSDVEEVAMRMCKQFLEKGKEKLDVVYDDMDMVPGPGGWLEDNPFGVRSDWESHVLARGDPMYRLMLCKR
ncbi:hypothetical protein BVRB_7g161710 isoform A [Beta vulgaris subsp. vulgaris]|uniref:uncharacterized protein LOC104898656 isoform X4 n=1 Tax=Beta vulgaris subsp. vulgaris TaxID=3555 RepID=UPI00053FAFC0|nr:uncharacterized protein LOC104898656 isoform X4 [Beta vulgaris subsp. vulgaris]KMT06243.1 hypothetical protein BVRB_7g161710 isoform A [Beta vulgaris subsp. vulgaris]